MPTRKWGSEKLVNTKTSGAQLASSVAVLADGSFIVVWQDGDAATADAVIRGQRFDALGNKVGGELLLYSSGGLDQTAPSVVGLPDGNFYVAWNRQFSATDDDAEGYVFSPAGTLLRTQRSFANNAIDDEFDPDVAALQNGGSVMVWREAAVGAPDLDIFMAIYDAAGDPITGTAIPVQVTDAFQFACFSPQVAVGPQGTILVTYKQYDAVRAELFTASGTFIREIRANTSGIGFNPVSTWLSDGSFVVAWQDEGNNSVDGINEMMARVFDAAGNPLTGPFRVNAATGGAQILPVITALPNGGFVVAWQDGSQSGLDNSGTAIRLQAFDASGAKIGSEIVVNTTTSGDQFDPSISALADGRVVVTWTDNGDIRMQIVDPRDGIVTGTGASETLYGHDLVNDEISAGAGNDTLLGLKGDDALYGGEGNDLLRGGMGPDYHDGGLGTDAADFADSTAGVAVNLTTGIASGGFAAGDTFVGVENLIGSAFGDALTGNSGANSIDGRAGADLMRGLAGNDTYVVDNAGDVADESLAGSNGADRVVSSRTFSLSDATHAKGSIENLTLTGTSAINGTGNALANTMVGNSAANALNGLTGADLMRGMGGNDSYAVDNAGDVVDESVAGSTGTDTVFSTRSFSLLDTVHAKGSVERLTLTGAALANATGNNLVNILTGNSAANVLNGWLGSDTMTGAAGNDIFRFDTALGASNIDTVTDYNVAADTIQLQNSVFTALTTTGTLAAAAFRIGAAAADSSDRIIYNSATGALIYDSNGNAGGGATQFAKLATGLALTNADFVVV